MWHAACGMPPLSEGEKGGSSHQESGKVTGNMEMKNKLCPKHGVTLTSKWNTDNILNSTIDVQVC